MPFDAEGYEQAREQARMELGAAFNHAVALTQMTYMANEEQARAEGRKPDETYVINGWQLATMNVAKQVLADPNAEISDLREITGDLQRQFMVH